MGFASSDFLFLSRLSRYHGLGHRVIFVDPTSSIPQISMWGNNVRGIPPQYKNVSHHQALQKDNLTKDLNLTLSPRVYKSLSFSQESLFSELQISRAAFY